MSDTIEYRLADFPPGLVAIPAMDWIYTDPVVAFMNLIPALPPGSALEIGRHSSSAAFNRNWLTRRFLDEPAWHWILYCDSDQTPPPVTAVRLLSHDVDIVGGLIVSRRPPYYPVIGGIADGVLPTGGLHEVPWLGGGCVLVRRRVLEAMAFPWFETPLPGCGEDNLFFEKARALGFRLHIDCSLSVGHMSARALTVQDAAEFQARPGGQEMLVGFPNIHPDEQREIDRGYARALAREDRTA